MSTRVVIVRHELILEPPNTILMVGHGTMDGISATKMHEQMFAWVGEQPCMFLLADMSDVTGFSTDGRKGLVESTGQLPTRAVALCGAPFPVRVVFDMVNRARSLLGKQGRWMKHFPDQKSARQWFDEMRPVVEAYARRHGSASG
jgi:hypothetical protein